MPENEEVAMLAADIHFNSKEVRSRRTAGDERVVRLTAILTASTAHFNCTNLTEVE